MGTVSELAPSGVEADELVFRLADPGHAHRDVKVWLDVALGVEPAMRPVPGGWELRLPLPDLDGDWSAWLADRCTIALARGAELRAELVAGTADPLDVWNRLGIELSNGVHAAHLMAQVHPDPELRAQAEGHVVDSEKFRTDLMLDADVYAALTAVSADGLEEGGARVL